METVRRLAEDIGPRRRDVAGVRASGRSRRRGIPRARVRRAPRPRSGSPEGCRGGCRCRPAGRRTWSRRRPGFRPDQPHVIVGAHLDTVPQAPGAEDNASGVARRPRAGPARRRGAARAAGRSSSPSAPRSRAGPADDRAPLRVPALRAGDARSTTARPGGDGVAGPRRHRDARPGLHGRTLAGRACSATCSPTPRGSASRRGAARTGPATTGRSRRRVRQWRGSAATATPATTPRATGSASCAPRRSTGSVGYVGMAHDRSRWLPRERTAAGVPDPLQDRLARPAGGHPRREVRADADRHELRRLQLGPPEDQLEERALLGLPGEVHVEDVVAERVGDRRAAPQLHALHPVRVPADDDVGAGVDQGAAHPALVGAPCGSCTACPSAAAPSPRRPVGRSARTVSSTRSRSAGTSGPVRGCIRSRKAPGRAARAAGVSPIASKATTPKRTPLRSTTAGSPGLAPGRRPPRPGRCRQPAPAVPSRRATRARSHRCGCWPVTARRTRPAEGPAAPAGRRRTSRRPAAARPSRDSVPSRLPTVRSAAASRAAVGRSAAAKSPAAAIRAPTRRASMMSPTTVAVVTAGRRVVRCRQRVGRRVAQRMRRRPPAPPGPGASTAEAGTAPDRRAVATDGREHVRGIGDHVGAADRSPRRVETSRRGPGEAPRSDQSSTRPASDLGGQLGRDVDRRPAGVGHQRERADRGGAARSRLRGRGRSRRRRRVGAGRVAGVGGARRGHCCSKHERTRVHGT